MEVFLLRGLALPASCPVPTCLADRLPQPTLAALCGSRGFHRASGTIRSSDDSARVASHFASAYRVTCCAATRRHAESSWGHARFFRTVPSAYTLVRWVDESAFASIVQARPCPTLGRPVRHADDSARLRPGTSPHALRIPPRGEHPALHRTPSGGFRSSLAVSGFRLRARLGLSIPSSLCGQRGVTPVFGYGAPHPSASGTSTRLNRALPSAHYSGIRYPPLDVKVSVGNYRSCPMA